jgi:hypothetical protein
MRQTSRQHQGSFLIELMMSLSLSLIMCFMLMQLYLVIHRSFSLQSELSQIEYNAETAITKLRENIYQSGYIGCARLRPLFPIEGELKGLLSSQNKIYAKDQGAIIVRYVSYHHATVMTSMQNSYEIKTNTEVRFKDGDIVLLSDCFHADILKIKKVYGNRHTQRLLPDRAIMYTYKKGSEIARMIVNQFEIKASNLKQSKKALYITDIHHRSQPIVDDVTAMQVRATVKIGDIIQERPASEVEDWSTVLGLSVQLTLSSLHLTKTWDFYAAVGELS